MSETPVAQQPPATWLEWVLDGLGTAPLAADGGGAPPIREDCARCGTRLERHSRTIHGPSQVYDHVACPGDTCNARGTIVRARDDESIELNRVGPALPARSTPTTTEEHPA